MAEFSKIKWPADGPVRDLLVYLDELHREAGQPSLTEIGAEVCLTKSTLSAFFTGTRLVSRGNLELLVSYFGGDCEVAERLRRKAATAWNARTARVLRPPPAQLVDALEVEPDADAGSRPAGRLDIVVYDTPTNKLNRPEHLFGRNELIAVVDSALDEHRRVLLYGLAGMGKTAVAAAVADQRVAAGRGPYLWIRCGTADEDVILDAMVRRLASAADRKMINTMIGDARLLALQGVLSRSGIALCVLDDAWNPPALFRVLRAIPDLVGVVATSRFKLGLEHRFEVAELADGDAAHLLATHANEPSYRHNPDGVGLCRDLGLHPYAIEIAGHHLSQYGLTPRQLREQVGDRPHDLSMPLGFAEAGRESMKRLLDRTAEALTQADGRLVFAAFGDFFSGGATVELLAEYLGWQPGQVFRALQPLVDACLVRRAGTSTFFELHDLTFSYARSLSARLDTGVSPVEVTRRFVANHIRDHDLLALDLDNIVGAAQQAVGNDIDAFLLIIEMLATGGYLDQHGHPVAFLRLLDHAIDTIRNGPDDHTDRLHHLLSKRGNAHYNCGEMVRAVELYRDALASAPTPQRRVILLGVIGKVLAELGEYRQAAEHFAQAYTEAEANGDDHGLLHILEQHSVAAFREQNFSLVRNLTTRGVQVSQQLGERSYEVTFLTNMGSADFELGVRASLEHHEQAHAIAQELGDDVLLALTHRLLGIDHHARENAEGARGHLNAALLLYQKLGHAESETKIRLMMREFGYGS